VGDATHAATSAVGDLTVNPAALTITADDQFVAYGAPLPALTASYSGLVNGDTPNSLTTAPTLRTTARPGSPFGTYPITVRGALDPNYTIRYVVGKLTIVTPPVSNDDSYVTNENTTLTVQAPGLLANDTAPNGDSLTAVEVQQTANGQLTLNP